MRDQFLTPENACRHLAIIHEFHPREQPSWDFSKPSHAARCRDAIKHGLERLAKLGFGGIVTNVSWRSYLEDEEKWRIFLAGIQAAKKLGFRIWLYDEAGYPSGAAGGIVLRDHPDYEAQALVRTRHEFDPGPIETRPPTGWLYPVRAEARYPDGKVADITSAVGLNGLLRLRSATGLVVTRFDARRAFEGTHCTRNVYKTRRYINVLQEEAVDCFYRVTAERYFERLGDDARLIEAVFTDEPSFMAAYFPELGGNWKDRIPVQDEPREDFDRLPMIPWERGLPERFRERWGYDITPELDRLFEGDSPRDLRVRHDFYQLQSEIYARVFFQMQQDRLAERGIAFSGHVLAEEGIVHHVACEGNVIADLKHMRIPGIDILTSIPEQIMDSTHLLTCKYGSSAAHAAAREQVMSEASDFVQRFAGGGSSLIERRGALAVQMALGVTTIASYYPWDDVDADEARRLLDFCARLAVVLRGSTHVADIALLYPIRAAWAHYKPVSDVLSAHLMDEPLRSMDSHLHRIARSIIAAGLDFDFIDTRDLIDSTSRGGRLRVGDESFSLVILPPGSVLCPKDLEAVERFVEGGGSVLAFEPLSGFALPEIADPPTGRDLGPGRSPAEVIAALRSLAPDRVRVASSPSGDWLPFALSSTAGDARTELDGTHMIARRSRSGDSNRVRIPPDWVRISESSPSHFVLIANGSREEANARVQLASGQSIEIWNPWEGTISPAASNPVDVTVPGYSALIVVSHA